MTPRCSEAQFANNLRSDVGLELATQSDANVSMLLLAWLPFHTRPSPLAELIEGALQRVHRPLRGKRKY